MSRLLLCSPETTRAVARRFGLTPERSRGQSFLVDEAVRDAIVASLPAEPDLTLEIGCGLGSLTQGLLEAGREVVGVEMDPRAVRALGLLQSRYRRLRVVAGNALRLGPEDLGLAAPFLAVGNIPYSLTGALVAHVLDFSPPAGSCHFLVQREVAERLAAEPGDWSLATLAVRLQADVRRRLEVGPESFWPRPRVHSSLIELRPLEAVAGPGEQARVLRLARPVFQQRRKQLRHGVAAALGVDSAAAASLLVAIGIDPSRRPGTLGLEEWLRVGALEGEG